MESEIAGSSMDNQGDEILAENIGANVEMPVACSSGSGGSRKLLKLSRKVDEVGLVLNLVPPRYAQHMLPEEVWAIIFELIGDKEHLWKASQTCGHFQDIIIQPSKNAWLFSEVFPFLFDHLNGKDILKCRTVCKSWRDGVDGYFENHASLTPHNDATYNPRRPMWTSPMEEKGLGQYRFMGEVEGSVFLEMFSHPRNPFLGRSVFAKLSKVDRTVAMDCESQFGDRKYAENLLKLENLFCGKLTAVLEKLGKHIWYMDLKVGYDLFKVNTLSRVAVNRFICEKLLNLLPNLRRLRLSGCLQREIDKNAFDVGWQDLEIPSHRHLVKLELFSSTYGFYTDPLGIMKTEKELLEKFRTQLKYIRMHNPRQLRWSCFATNEFPTLTELDIGNLSSGPASALSHLKKFVRLRAPNLQKVTIDMSALKPDELEFLLRALREAPESMPHLNVIRLVIGYLLPFEEEVKAWLGLQENISLPSYFTALELCDLSRIGFRRFYKSAMIRAKFLHLFNAVKSISYNCPGVSYGATGETEAPPIIPEVEVYDLNMWTELKQLQIVSCENTVYTRSRYKEFQEKRLSMQTEKEDECPSPGNSESKLQPKESSSDDREVVSARPSQIVTTRYGRRVNPPDRYTAK